MNLRENLKENGGLLTGFAVVAIIVSGITLIEYPEKWWIAALVVTGFFLSLFLLFNYVAVLKSFMATAVTLVLATVAFNLAAYSSDYSALGFFWFFSFFLVFTLALAISYFIPSGQSRWTGITLSVIFFFGFTYGLTTVVENLWLTIGLGLPMALGLFVLFMLFGKRSRWSTKAMPSPETDTSLVENFRKAAQLGGYEFRDRSKKDGLTFMLWKERGYILYPVRLDQAFGLAGKKKKLQLSYKSKPLAPWLRYISFVKNPTFKARGANLLTVLVDLNNANGKETRVIGVKVPDSKTVTPVAVLPGKLFLSSEERALGKALKGLEVGTRGFGSPLTEKQIKALGGFKDLSKETSHE